MQTNYIKCGDNVQLMKTLPDECIDLTVTSPPYDNLRKYNGFDWDLESVVNELYRITKWGGVIVWVTNDATIKGSESCSSFIHALTFKSIGFNLHDTMIWYKDSFSLPDTTRYGQCFEYMFVFSKGKPKAA